MSGVLIYVSLVIIGTVIVVGSIRYKREINSFPIKLNAKIYLIRNGILYKCGHGRQNGIAENSCN